MLVAVRRHPSNVDGTTPWSVVQDSMEGKIQAHFTAYLQTAIIWPAAMSAACHAFAISTKGAFELWAQINLPMRCFCQNICITAARKGTNKRKLALNYWSPCLHHLIYSLLGIWTWGFPRGRQAVHQSMYTHSAPPERGHSEPFTKSITMLLQRL